MKTQANDAGQASSGEEGRGGMKNSSGFGWVWHTRLDRQQEVEELPLVG